MGICYDENKRKINLRKEIKSVYIIKEIFSFFLEKKKLDLITYNKKLQNIVEIDIEYYKKISGKYIVGERNGKGKEYKFGSQELLFEGNYLNGKRNGQGIEFYEIKRIKFIGSFLKGKKVKGNAYYYERI